MPDEEINVESTEENESSKVNKILIFVIIGVVLLILGTVAFLMFRPGNSDVGGNTDVTLNDAHEAFSVYKFEKEFLVNLSDYDERHYVSCNVTLGIMPKQYSEVSKTIAAKLELARDLIHTIIMSHKSYELETPKGKAKLKTQIKDELNNKLFGVKYKDPIKEVYLEYMVQ